MKILFQGDSITDGNRYKDEASRWDKNHQIGHTYVYIVTGLLGMKFPEQHYEFVNRGISGNRTVDLLSRWEKDTLSENPDVLSVLIGVNDCNYPVEGEENDVACVGYEKRYRELLTLAKANNSSLRLILLEPFGYLENWNCDADNLAVRREKMANEQRIVKTLAAEFDAVFVPLQSAFDAAKQEREASYWIWDGVHPTEAGHAIIAREFFKCTKPIFNFEL